MAEKPKKKSADLAIIIAVPKNGKNDMKGMKSMKGKMPKKGK